MPRPAKAIARRRTQIGVGGVQLSAIEKRLVKQALDNDRLSYGPFARAFENRFAKLHDRRFAIFMNSGTSALQVALHALKETRGWSDGDEIIVPALTFVATVNVVLQNNLTPVFVDIEPDHFGIDPQQLERAISPRTRAIIPVHPAGQPADMAPIVAFARARGLAILEDSCETMFARYRGKPVGSFGDIACFSTYAAHILVTGVGGLAITDDPELAVMMKSLANHGRDAIYTSMDDDKVDDATDLFKIVSRRFSFIHAGYSYRATELEAAIGVGQLRRWRSFVARRKANAKRLTASLADLEPTIRLPRIRPGSEHVFMMFPMVLADGFDRESLVRHLEYYKVETRYMLPLLSQPIYKRLFGDIGSSYPNAHRVDQQGFYVGCHPEVGSAEIRYISDVMHAYFAEFGRSKERRDPIKRAARAPRERRARSARRSSTR
ncbi:MAG TPA: DegT/DnrJ/EryC1/StrS family aminotransferase [Candidatus Limnocylindria bacterium]|nr:DegT/DnrJ/EryC1/StrS family aminotransferase [Candidatus Limnocylindria bacterium]